VVVRFTGLPSICPLSKVIETPAWEVIGLTTSVLISTNVLITYLNNNYHTITAMTTLYDEFFVTPNLYACTIRMCSAYYHLLVLYLGFIDFFMFFFAR